MMLKRIWVVFPTLFSVFLISSTKVNADSYVTLKELLIAIDKLVGYYANNYHLINLDGIFGLRAVEGQILNMLTKYATEPKIRTFPLWANTQLQSTYATAKDAADSSIMYLKKNSPKYYQNLKYLVDKPLTVMTAYRRIDTTFVWDALEKKNLTHGGNFTEEFSDSCMALIMGTGSPPQPKCTFSDECMKMMFTKGMLDYTITHQLLFTMLAEQEGCLPKLNAALLSRGYPGGAEHMRLEFCTNNFFEVAAAVKVLGGTIVPRYQDLFMEQEFVCPALGFMEFLHSDWLAQMIEWQRPSGCFGAMKRKTPFRGVAIGDDSEYEYVDKMPKPDENHQNEVIKQDNVVPKRDDARKVNRAGIAPTKDITRRSAGNAPLPWDRNVDGIRGRDEIRPEHDRSQIGNVQNPGEKRSVNEAGPLGQQGVQTKLGAGQQKQWYQEQHGGKMYLPPLHNVPAIPQKSNGYRTRRLLVEEALPDGCLSHKTAVAAGALSQYLRYMLVPGSPFYQRHTRLTGVNYLLNPHNLRSQAVQQGLPSETQDKAVPKHVDNHPDDARQGKDNAEIDPKKDYEAGQRQPEEINAVLDRHVGDDQRALGDDHGAAPRDDRIAAGDDHGAHGNEQGDGHGAQGDDQRAPGDDHDAEVNDHGAPGDHDEVHEDDDGAPQDDHGEPPRKDDVVDIDGKPADDRYVDGANENHADVDKETDDRDGKEIVVGDPDRNGEAYEMVNGPRTSNVSATLLLKAYVLIIAVMFVVIVFMCKVLRRHRVFIRYRHR